ncbi:hypothetical protein PF005_g27801 [Phytophthora fragariae]|nr:hypothetical protein PF007_g27739 [Phytophthora fragariae]KAE9169823.1 hypothetical protein PF005_g27801 [Phytophthora fragariae]
MRGGTPKRSSSGTIIVKVNQHTGDFKVQHVTSTIYGGANVTTHRAVLLGTLWGLRKCFTQHWETVHVMGDNQDVLQQQLNRAPPRAKQLKGDYWKTRRLADAVAVQSWTTQLREFNRTANELARMAQSTGRDMDWHAGEMPNAGAKWEGITRFIKDDVKQWFLEKAKSTSSKVVEAKV